MEVSIFAVTTVFDYYL